MIKAATSLGKTGLQDWLLQRISAVILGLYFCLILGVMLRENPLDYASWHALFAARWMRFFSLAALLSLVLHAWIGLWTISTDYIKAIPLRLCFQCIVLLALFAQCGWGICILWGIY